MRREFSRTLLAYLLPIMVLLWGLRRVLASFGEGIWGPSTPWLNGDFNGSWWLWWASSEFWRGTSWWGAVGWPEGLSSLAPVFPNPGDMFLLGAIGPPSPLFWNTVQLFHLAALVIATAFLARTAGASRFATVVGSSLVAASPVLLHEVAGGRPTNLVVWPGLLALAALIRGRWLGAGLWGALQGMLYVFHGLVLVLIALPLVRNRREGGRALAVLVVASLPYLWWLQSGMGGIPMDSPPDGFTALPLAGLLGQAEVVPRFQLHPVLLPVALLGLRGGWRWLLAGVIGLVLALGPWPTWALGEPLGAGLSAWLAWVLPPLERMHHPIRACLLALPLLAVAVAIGLDHLRWARVAGVALMLAALSNGRAMDQASTYASESEPPFSDLEIPGEGPLVDLLGGRHLTALSLQPFHRRPILETPFSRRRQDSLAPALEALSRGEEPAAALWRALRSLGFESVLVLDRLGSDGLAEGRVEEALGAPVSEGVYRLEPSP